MIRDAGLTNFQHKTSQFLTKWDIRYIILPIGIYICGYSFSLLYKIYIIYIPDRVEICCEGGYRAIIPGISRDLLSHQLYIPRNKKKNKKKPVDSSTASNPYIPMR